MRAPSKRRSRADTYAGLKTSPLAAHHSSVANSLEAAVAPTLFQAGVFARHELPARLMCWPRSRSWLVQDITIDRTVIERRPRSIARCRLNANGLYGPGR